MAKSEAEQQEMRRRRYTFKRNEFMRPDRPESFIQRWDRRPLRAIDESSPFFTPPLDCYACGSSEAKPYTILSNRRSPVVLHNACTKRT